MRTAFFSAVSDLAERDPRVVLLTGDLGFGAVEGFAGRFPERFINVGIAEQNMIGLATGLAMTGHVVFAYSIGNFPTLRCLEQIRNGPCAHGLSVVVVTVGGGLSYGVLGSSHHATEDLAIMRSLPGLTVVAPGDPVEAGWATGALAATGGPGYLRLGRAGEPRVHEPGTDLRLGTAVFLRRGTDVSLLCTGSMLTTALATADVLAAAGTSAEVVHFHTVTPLDTEALVQTIAGKRLVASIEEHSVVGGFGSAVAEHLSGLGSHPPLYRCGLPPSFIKPAGKREYLLERAGLGPESLAARIRAAIEQHAVQQEHM